MSAATKSATLISTASTKTFQKKLWQRCEEDRSSRTLTISAFQATSKQGVNFWMVIGDFTISVSSLQLPPNWLWLLFGLCSLVRRPLLGKEVTFGTLQTLPVSTFGWSLVASVPM